MLLIKNIGAILGARAAAPEALKGEELADLPVVTDAWLTVDGERIAAFGTQADLPAETGFQTVVDARGGYILRLAHAYCVCR